MLIRVSIYSNFSFNSPRRLLSKESSIEAGLRNIRMNSSDYLLPTIDHKLLYCLLFYYHWREWKTSNEWNEYNLEFVKRRSLNWNNFYWRYKSLIPAVWVPSVHVSNPFSRISSQIFLFFFGKQYFIESRVSWQFFYWPVSV